MQPREMLQMPPPKKTPADSQGGGILVLYSSKFRLFVPFSQSSRFYLQPSSKDPENDGWVALGLLWSRQKRIFLWRCSVIRLQDTGTLHVHYPGNMQLADAPCPENPSLHQRLLSRVPACSLITLIYPITSTAVKQEPPFPPCFVYENTHQLTRCLLAIIGFNSLSLLSIKSQENTGI